MSSSSIFQNFSNKVEDKSLIMITKDILNGKYKEEVEQIRTLINEGDEERANLHKKKLPAFTPSGTFKKKRVPEDLVDYSHFIVLDFDKIDPDDYSEAFRIACSLPYTFCCFRSPSGSGMKILVEVTSGALMHKSAFKRVADYYEEHIGLPIDRSGSDINRLCFMSYDPDTYRKINSQKFEVQEVPDVTTNQVPEQRPSKAPKTSLPSHDTQDPFEHCVNLTKRKSTYEPGNRNNFIHLLACNCNRAGIEESNALHYILGDYDLDPDEIKSTVRSAYQNNVADFAKFAKSAKLQEVEVDHTQEEMEPVGDTLQSTPFIPHSVFDTLPDLLKEGCRVFDDARKRDVFLTSALATLSGCLPNVTGVYNQDRVYPHLYCFIVAPAASGKGVLKYAKQLGYKYHQDIVEKSKAEKIQYEADLLEYKEHLKKKSKKDDKVEPPVEPPFQLLFIPANCSNSRLIQHLQFNGGRGIIFETEADTMSKTKGQDWGDYSTILRMASHHETISISRKTNDEYLEVENPRIAIILAGTPAQVPRLLESAEDGLFSRFIFYLFRSELLWQDVSPKGSSIVFNDHFDQLSTTVLEVAQLMELSPTEVLLSEEQWNVLNSTFKDLLSDVTTFANEEASAVVFRLGLITFRICMIFTALRKAENAEVNYEMHCLDSDFQNALLIATTYLQHSIILYHNLPNQGESTNYITGDNNRRFFEALPEEFTRKDAIGLAKSFDIKERSADMLLRNAVGELLTKVKTGVYRKIN